MAARRSLPRPTDAAPRRLLLLLAALALLALAPAAEAAVPAHGRAWELVGPQDAHGAQPVFARAWAPDGDRLLYATFGPQPGAVSGELLSHGVAVRGASGWSFEPVTVPFTSSKFQLLGTLALAVSEDLGTWAWGSTAPLLPGAPAPPLTGVYRRDPGGALTLLGDIGETQPLNLLSFPAASSDLQHLAFNSEAALLPADSGRIAGRAAYEFAGTSLRLAGVDDSGTPLSPCGAVIGGGSDSATVSSAMSRAGSRLFLTSPDPSTGECAQPTGVFLREGGETTEVSASRCARPDCGPPAASIFAGATVDGSIAYFTSEQQLLDGDTDAVADLYRYDVEGGGLSRVSAGPPGVGAEVLPQIRLPQAGGRVYFAAYGALVPGKGVTGERNIYLAEGGALRYVGSLGSATLREAAISADGRVLLFASTAKLLPGDLDEQTDVYRYDAGDGSLRQLSLGTSGGNGPFEATVPAVEEIFPSQRYNALTPDGERAFLTTAEPLLPEDHNDTADLYEWAGGTLGLISSGAAGAGAATFEGTSADGRSAFFETKQSLLAADRDGGELDIYVARLGGGFPEAPPPPPCEGEACQGALGAAAGRPALRTLAPPRGERGRGGGGKFAVAPLGKRARRELAETGRGEVVVRAPAPGQVSLTAFATIGARQLVVARSHAIAWRQGKLTLPLRLGAAAKSVLARPGGTLKLRLVVRHSRVAKPRTVLLTLGEGR